MQSDAKTVPAYLKELPADRRAALSSLRKLIKEAAPDAKESMRYGMPYYELGEGIFSFAAQKHYLALYVCGIDIGKFKSRLGKSNCGQGCVRFKRLADLSLDGLTELLEEAAAAARGKGEGHGKATR